MKVQTELETRCNNAETEYKSYLSEAQKAINDAHTAKIDAKDVESDLDSVKGNVREWVMAKTNVKQRLRDLLSKFTNLFSTRADESVLDDVCDGAKKRNIEHRQVDDLNKPLTEHEIITRVGGGDQTDGSCSSLAFTYAGNRCGFDVLDFRDGESREFFSESGNIMSIAKKMGGIVVKNKSDFTSANQLLKKMKEGKEYYFTCGKHAAIVRKISNGYEYLELQSPYFNGFKLLTTTALKDRFGAQKSHSFFGMKYATQDCIIDIDEIKKNKEAFRKMLAYINTEESKQNKGMLGTIK